MGRYRTMDVEESKAYNGLSILPYDGGTYKQAIWRLWRRTDKMVETLKNINLSRVTEEQDNTDLKVNLK